MQNRWQRAHCSVVLTALVIGFCATGNSWAKQNAIAGHAQTAIRDIEAQLDQAPPRQLSRGDAIFSGDSLRTGNRSYLAIQFADESRLHLGENSQFEVNSYHVESEKPYALRIVKGLFRFISGKMPQKKKSQFRLHSLTATIGIRGTNFAGEVDGEHTRIMLLQDEEQRDSSIVVSNAFGSVEITEPGFGTEIPDANSPPSKPRRMRLQALQQMMRNLNQMQRRSIRR